VLRAVVISPITAIQGVVNTFGFGSGHSAELLRDIADAGGGQYFFIQGGKDIADVFTTCVGGLLSVVGTNVELVFEPANGCKIKQLLGKRYNKNGQVNTDAGVSLKAAVGDLQAGESRDVLCLVEVPALAQPLTDASPIALIALSYTEVRTKKIVTASFAVPLRRPDVLGPNDIVPHNPAIEAQRMRLLGTQALADAIQAANSGNVDKGRTLIKEAEAKLAASPEASNPVVQQVATELRETVLNDLASESAWSSSGSKMANMRMQSHEQQRAYGGAESAAYQNKSKVSKKAAMLFS